MKSATLEPDEDSSSTVKTSLLSLCTVIKMLILENKKNNIAT